MLVYLKQWIWNRFSEHRHCLVHLHSFAVLFWWRREGRGDVWTLLFAVHLFALSFSRSIHFLSAKPLLQSGVKPVCLLEWVSLSPKHGKQCHRHTKTREANAPHRQLISWTALPVHVLLLTAFLPFFLATHEPLFCVWNESFLYSICLSSNLSRDQHCCTVDWSAILKDSPEVCVSALSHWASQWFFSGRF